MLKIFLSKLLFFTLATLPSALVFYQNPQSNPFSYFFGFSFSAFVGRLLDFGRILVTAQSSKSGSSSSLRVLIFAKVAKKIFYGTVSDFVGFPIFLAVVATTITVGYQIFGDRVEYLTQIFYSLWIATVVSSATTSTVLEMIPKWAHSKLGKTSFSKH